MKRIHIEETNHYNLGFKYGQQARDEILAMIELIKSYALEKVGGISKVLLPLLLALTPLVKRKFGSVILKELRGMSKGSGINIKWLYFINFTYEFGAISNSFFKFMGCSSLAMKHLDNEHVLIGKTTDIIENVHFTKTLIKNRIRYSYRVGGRNLVETITFPGQVTSDFAVLNRKIFVGFNDGGLNTKKNYFSKTSFIPFLRNIYETGNDIEEIKKKMKEARVIHPIIALVSDGKTSGTFTAEIMHNRSRIFPFVNRITRTNCLMNREDKDREYKKGWRKDPFYLCAKRRLVVLRSKTSAGNGIDDVISILKSHTKSLNMMDGSINSKATSNAVVWDGNKKELYFADSDGSFPLALTKKWELFS